MHIYWTTIYDHGKKLDLLLELEQLNETSWSVTLDDDNYILETTRQPSDFWGLVQEALVLIKPNE
jgi:hypothetical protein